MDNRAMIISCPECGIKYRFDENTLGDKSKKIKCAKCEARFTVKPPQVEATHVGVPGADDETLDTTKVVNKDEILDSEGGATLDGKRYSIAILNGTLAGQVFQVQKRVTVMGRAFGDILVPDQESSRKHCQIEIRPEGVYLKDLGSTNGTFIDGKAIQEVEIHDKTEFVIGNTSLMLIVSSD